MNFVIEDKKQEIMDEMISKVDKVALHDMFQVISANCRIKNMDGIEEIYLREWAKAKYEFYLMLGKNLSMSKEIDIVDDSNSIARRCQKVCDMKTCVRNRGKEGKETIDTQHFIVYKKIISMFSEQDFVNNKCPRNEVLEKYCSEYYKPGMKLTKFFSSYFQDVNFDIEISKCLQNKHEKGRIVLSIDPCDYLTMSCSSTGWCSCYRIDSYYKAATLSCMIDETSMIAYRPRGSKYEFYYDGKRFTWNDKQCRSVIEFDKNTGGFCVLRGQGSIGMVMYEEFKGLVSDAVSQYLGKEAGYAKSGAWPKYKIGTMAHHLADDIMSDMVFIMEDGEKKFNITIGRTPISLSTGEPCKETEHMRKYPY